jgi:hypothetical protein
MDLMRLEALVITLLEPRVLVLAFWVIGDNRFVYGWVITILSYCLEALFEPQEAI